MDRPKKIAHGNRHLRYRYVPIAFFIFIWSLQSRAHSNDLRTLPNAAYLSPSLTLHHGAGRDTVSLAPFQTHASFSLDTCPSPVHCGLEAKKIPLRSWRHLEGLPSGPLSLPWVSPGWAIWCCLLDLGLEQRTQEWVYWLHPPFHGHHKVKSNTEEKHETRDFPGGQRLGLHPSPAGGMDRIPGGGTKISPLCCGAQSKNKIKSNV